MNSTADTATSTPVPSTPPTHPCPGLVETTAWDAAELLRGEIYGTDRLVEHAADLARAHGVPSLRATPGPLRARFASAKAQVRAAYEILSREVGLARAPSPAEEWLLDNAHVVEEQLREIQEDLPRGYLVELPRLTKGLMRGFPRVYGLCLDYLRHTDARIDVASLTRFVDAYQSVDSLTIGELWAVPIMLRLGLVLAVGALAASEASASKAVADPGTTPDQRVRHQHLQHSADRVSVGNAITSMRAIGALDWHAFFEHTSVVEAALVTDPSGDYANMDDVSRDRYRHAVEDLARRSPNDEVSIARAAHDLAMGAKANPECDGAEAHLGYYLIGDGRRALEGRIKYRPRLGELLRRPLLTQPTACYLGAILFGTCFATATALACSPNKVSLLGAIGLVCVMLFPASEIALALVNGLVLAIVPPRLLPKLEFKRGVPPEHRTLVAVPALLDGPETLAKLLEDLEVRALASPDANLHFALLTDWTDAPVASRPEDDALLARAVAGIEALNAHYGADRFALFHRRRTQNTSEGCWMGWERKRGKLEELSRVLRGATDTSFSVVTAPAALLATVRYVITLDADTELPRDVARRLVGTIAHPLNRPRLDAARTRVVKGHGVIQPRVGT
ncbi:MAG: glycosyl transferase family 36, partial [Polyangiales bacterium]